MAPLDSHNYGRNFAKRNQSDAELAEILRMVVIDIVINTILGRLTLDPAGMHCAVPSYPMGPAGPGPGPPSLRGPQTADALIFSSREISVTNCVLFTA